MPEWADIQVACLVLLALVGFVLTVDRVVDVLNKWLNKPKKESDDFREDTMERLKRGDVHMERQDEAIELLLQGQLQILQHLAYGNHTDKLKDAISDIQTFLIKEREV